MSQQGDADDSGTEISDVLCSTVEADDDVTRPLLERGELELIGRMPFSSNATFLVDLRLDDERTQAIYKPERGERPLHDFEPGLWRREIAAYVLSHLGGWSLVPPTVERDGPLGTGSVQFFCPSDYSQHYFTLKEAGAHDDVFRSLCAFDVIINNTDRKSGHVLAGDDGHLWAIDNGLSFHSVSKLRTVIWDFAGGALGADLTAVVAGLAEADLGRALGPLLDAEEIEATRGRARALVTAGTFPIDHSGRAYPWPLV